MVYLNILLTVKETRDIETVRALLAEAGRLSRAEPGCLRFEVYQSNTDPARFFLNEHWESQQALEVHRTGQAYTTIYQPRVMPLIEREGHPCGLIE
jgi:quinol monooxygenase YgiN